MPTYAYRCTNCAHEFEAVQKFSDDPLKQCPECDAEIRRVFQPVGIVFKGSGWYINDSRKGSDKSNSDSTAKAASTESKPAKSEAPASSSSSTTETAAPAKAAAD